MQFDDLLVVIKCNAEVDPAVEIRLQNIGEVLYGIKDRSALVHCQDVYQYLKKSTKNWRESMDKQRK